MTRRALVTIAKTKKVLVRNHSNANIIRAIQRAEGNQVCFGTDKVMYCEQKDCLWREDCLSVFNGFFNRELDNKTEEYGCNKYNF